MAQSQKNKSAASTEAKVLKKRATAPGRRERKAQETRIRIFRAALQLISERGLNGVTVEQITEAADVGKGTFFNYFSTKEHVLGVMAEIQSAKVQEAAEQALKGGQSIHDVLERLLQRLAGELGKTPGLLSGFVGTFFSNEVVRGLIREAVKRNLGIIATVIAAGQQRGEIDKDLDSRSIASQMVRACWGSVLMWALFQESTIAECIDETFEAFWLSIAVAGRKQAL
jgi:AcrR family transcriptional regulator